MKQEIHTQQRKVSVIHFHQNGQAQEQQYLHFKYLAIIKCPNNATMDIYVKTSKAIRRCACVEVVPRRGGCSSCKCYAKKRCHINATKDVLLILIKSHHFATQQHPKSYTKSLPSRTFKADIAIPLTRSKTKR